MVLHNVFRGLPKTFLAASTEEKKVCDAIKKQNDEVKKQQEKVKNLIDRIAAEIERTSCEGGRYKLLHIVQTEPLAS